MAKKTDFIDSNQRKIKNPLSSFHKTVSSFRDFKVLFGTVKKRKVQQTRLFTGLFGGELGIRTLGPFRDTAFRVLHLRPLGQLSMNLANIIYHNKRKSARDLSRLNRLKKDI